MLKRHNSLSSIGTLIAASVAIAILIAPKSVSAAGPVNGFKHRIESRQQRAKIPVDEQPAEQKAVEAALSWLARHQNKDGSWALQEHHARDKKCDCDGVGDTNASSAATAMALLPFLAEGYSHTEKSQWQQTVKNGVNWLMSHQKQNGDLSALGAQQMYSHGIAAIAIAEAYGVSGDARLRASAQAALNFIEQAQSSKKGGWGYSAGADHCDTSIFGWQFMALKAGEIGQLKVQPRAWAGSAVWLKSVGKGKSQGLYSYLPDSQPSPSMTAIGTLSSLMVDPQSESAQEGADYLIRMKFAPSSRNCYFWHYGVQAMHQVGGESEKTWLAPLHKHLAEQQSQEGCSKGSWDPERPTPDPWGKHGGRLMVTSFSTLALQPYRYQGNAMPSK